VGDAHVRADRKESVLPASQLDIPDSVVRQTDPPIDLNASQVLSIAGLYGVRCVSRAPQEDTCRVLGGAGGEPITILSLLTFVCLKLLKVCLARKQKFEK
jgi:hypothetical protein